MIHSHHSSFVEKIRLPFFCSFARAAALSVAAGAAVCSLWSGRGRRRGGAASDTDGCNLRSLVDDEPPEPLRPQKTCYEVNGVTLSVDGFAYRQDPRGGNLSAHGKATGEAFWPASRLLMDHLVRDCALLKDGRPRRVVELGCGLGLAGSRRGDDAVHDQRQRSYPHGWRRKWRRKGARVGMFNARGHMPPVSCVEHRWGEPDPRPLRRRLAPEVLNDPNVALESSKVRWRSRATRY